MEIQVQTRNRFRWQPVQKPAAGYDMSIKYGGGHPEAEQVLLELSEAAWQCDLEGVNLPESDIARAHSVILSAYSGYPGRPNGRRGMK